MSVDKMLRVRGGASLTGSVTVQGSKNAALPVMAAAILLGEGEQLTLSNVPQLKDTKTFAELLEDMGAKVNWNNGTVIIQASGQVNHQMPDHLVRKMRASSLVLGPLLGRTGKAIMPLPGGCSIGARPLDLHLKGLAKMGATIELQGGAVHAEAKQLRGERIYLDFPSVGATENLLMAAAVAKGTTVIENAAREPEIENLADALVAMGATISGADSGIITIEGVGGPLHSGKLSIIPDRIVAGTFLLAGLITNSSLTVNKVIPAHFDSLLAKLDEGGATVAVTADRVTLEQCSEFKGLEVKTLPYPGFPTDLQPQMMAVLALAKGSSTVTESIFENRFMHVPELLRMGASIDVKGTNCAVIEGVKSFSGCHVNATDLRAGAALTIAGLAASGETFVHGLDHILRGYENFESHLQQLGADVAVVPVSEDNGD